MSPQHHPPGTSRGGQFKAYSRGEMSDIALNDANESRLASYGASSYRDQPDADDLREIEAEMRAADKRDAARRSAEAKARFDAMTPQEREAAQARFEETMRNPGAAWNRISEEYPEPPF